MEKIYPVTLEIAPGERSFALYEINDVAIGGTHRFQIILVKRGEQLAEYRIDMGKVEKWKNKRFINIPSFWLHSVSELQFIADQIRNESLQDELDIAELLDKDGKVIRYF